MCIRDSYERFIRDRIKSDRNFEARFLHFLLDDQDYIEKEKSRVKPQTQKKYLELMSIAPKSKGGKQTKKNSTNLEQADEDFLRDIGVIG